MLLIKCVRYLCNYELRYFSSLDEPRFFLFIFLHSSEKIFKLIDKNLLSFLKGEQCFFLKLLYFLF